MVPTPKIFRQALFAPFREDFAQGIESLFFSQPSVFQYKMSAAYLQRRGSVRDDEAGLALQLLYILDLLGPFHVIPLSDTLM